MILRAGFQTFEFQQAPELPRPLVFASHDEALKWLRQLGFLDAGTISELRRYLGRFADASECSRLTDNEVLERVAILLYSRKIVVVARLEVGGSGAGSEKTPPIPIPFPLAERTARASSSSYKPPVVEDSPTFDPRLIAVSQAAALVAAAQEGMPFCPE
jgi:hypothetical protein